MCNFVEWTTSKQIYIFAQYKYLHIIMFQPTEGLVDPVERVYRVEGRDRARICSSLRPPCLPTRQQLPLQIVSDATEPNTPSHVHNSVRLLLNMP